VRVLFCTEGTYPYVGGGVSTWCDILCRELDDVEFVIFTVTGNPEVELKYTLPDNARQIIHVPLWGMQEPAELPLSELPFRDFLGRKRRTTERAVREGFVPALRTLLRAMEDEERPIEAAGDAVHRMWRWFQEHDWNRTWKAQATWDAFVEESLEPYRSASERYLPGEGPTVEDLTTALRWSYNFLMPLVAPIPDVDLVHTTIAGFAGLPGVVAKIERGTPFVVTEHGVFVRERYIAVSAAAFTFYAKRFLMRLASVVARLNYHYADVVSPVANFNQRWEVRFGTEQHRIQTIYNGIDPELFVPGPKPDELQGRPVAVAAARVFPLKDVETMIRSAAVARRDLPDVVFRVYGSLDADKPYVDRCRALIEELDLGQTFEFGGFHSSPAQVYNIGDISVLSSISEGFPYTVLESMSCARPVAATDVGGVREALEGFGLVVPPRDPESLGEAVTTLLRDHDLRLDLGRRAREQVLSHYRTSHSVGAYRLLYRQLTVDAAVEELEVTR
jgi:glycosyltransferase involved in cell wall biosynthesis